MLNWATYILAMSYSKSHAIPEAFRANVMNWFRVPMNIITCAALLCLHIDWIAYDKRVVFGACLVICFMGFGAVNAFLSVTSNENGANGDTAEAKGPRNSPQNTLNGDEESEVKEKLLDA